MTIIDLTARHLQHTHSVHSRPFLLKSQTRAHTHTLFRSQSSSDTIQSIFMSNTVITGTQESSKGDAELFGVTCRPICTSVNSVPPSPSLFPSYIPFIDPLPHLCTSTRVYFRSPASPWMVFLMRSSMVVSHWSRRDTESNSFTASVNASLFCSSWASRSFCADKHRRWQRQLRATGFLLQSLDLLWWSYNEN